MKTLTDIMEGWWSERPKKPERREPGIDLERLAEQDLAILFKHSTACPVSWAADARVHTFMEQNPTIPVHTVSVLDDRALSRQITEWTGVKHASPQVIILRRGAVVSTTSHGGVTAAYLTERTRSETSSRASLPSRSPAEKSGLAVGVTIPK